LRKRDEKAKLSLLSTLIQKSINVKITDINVRTPTNISLSKLAPYLETPIYLYKNDFLPYIYFQTIKGVSPLVS
jgi:hypothetical protein